ncbi:FadR/GntR family transcriptional regulator [Clostridium felsineum]|uniref:L-lactate dehydrogenase operon regulatory protein n=1 Tax=Clostridium felsineum TaxID=36839 RepID=A0A1S8L350_9CLOT|nr:FadR/GntR family transcriptional regulator [Clostridium felsineum]MCR3761045.1 FadR family transcriptional regulator [Clostridium felsineum]URZ04327.1 Putative L-lactate dehydrogenase operon regulatory protein [Clostridium felsineum]URZ07459.1 Putative L-lactate dehydrogenase operon regulatory protein [Clostridium felsineum]URZ12490.1 Putative L-lactate dehydrogenase operon regulatory protein [Clostridium felsineum]URZ17152.1 Putative L-lactate dehydrogenase operon regulatory protein [Clost
MFSPVKSTKVYEQVIEQFKTMIADGTLKKGDRLPSERELVSQLGVSRASIREALSALQMIGFVEARHGEGNFIRENFEESLIDPFLLIFMLNGSNKEQILELRRIIEVETAAIAAEKINNEEIEKLEECLNGLLEAQDEVLKGKYDKEFHYNIAKASKNILIVNMLNAVSSLMDAFITEARGKILMVEGNKDVLMNQHSALLKALKNHDPKAASKAMREHLDLIFEYIKDR